MCHLSKQRFVIGFQSAPLPFDEPFAHQGYRENTLGRGMVLASRFRGSYLRLSLFGLVCAAITTGVLEARAG